VLYLDKARKNAFQSEAPLWSAIKTEYNINDGMGFVKYNNSSFLSFSPLASEGQNLGVNWSVP